MSDEKSSEITFDEFKRIDARVGTITQVERVPRTEKLYRILVDLGSLGVKQTVSSLVGYYEPNELVGKRVVLRAKYRRGCFWQPSKAKRSRFLQPIGRFRMARE
jgi:tRNA-binding EMAP/Myf-like protein